MSKELLTAWDRLYTAKVGARYPVNGGKDGALLKGLRAIYSDEDIARFMTAFFQMEDPFFEQTGWSLGCFRSALPKVIASANRKPRVVEREPQHWQWCDHAPKCATHDDCRLLNECQHEPICWSLNACRELRHKAS